METYNNVLCISHAELTSGIITNAALMHLCDRNEDLRVRRSSYGTPALYAVESLPIKYRTEVKKRYSASEEQAEARKFIDMVVIDNAAAAYYESVKIEGARGLSTEKRMLYTHNASILNTCKQILDEADSEQRKQNKRNRVLRRDFWQSVAERLPRIADIYPHTLPENPRVLQRKFGEYYKDGERHYEVFISGKFKNKNAARIATPEQIALITKFIGFHTNLDCAEVAEYYNTVAGEFGWQTIDRRTVWNWAQKYGWAVNAGRYGAKDYMNKLGMQVKRYAPTAPMLYWTLDGWTVELYYKKRSNGKKGTMTYCHRLTVVVVLDAFNKYPIGYAIGEHECPALIKMALRNATNHTAELFGERLRPVQIQSDNYQIKIMLPIYGIAEYVTPAQVGNAKAKIIEPYFKYLNKKYAKKCAGNWSGYGITSRKESQPNLEWLNAHKGEIPDEATVRGQIEWIVSSERELKREAYLDGYKKLPAERRLPMTTESYLLTFGEETGYKNALEGSGLNIRLLGAKRTYDSFDIEFRKYSHIRWNVKYDPDNLQEVLAVSDEGDIRFLLEEKHLQPMALADRRAGDSEALQRVKDFNQELKRTVVEFDQENTELVRASLLQHPDYNNPYAKSLITDSRGQHKDRRNKYRLEYTEVAEEAEYEERVASGAESTFDLY